jgi:hypothetical protein
VFDWLVGMPEASQNFDARWTRDMAAMSLRGLQWTAPTGAMFLALGYGWLPLASGAMMGPVYECGYRMAVQTTEFWAQVPWRVCVRMCACLCVFVRAMCARAGALCVP